jgi:O-antigen ligase
VTRTAAHSLPDFVTNKTVARLPWLAAAICAGILAGALPAQIAIIGFGIAAILLCAAITPLATLVALVILAPLRALIATEAPNQLPLDIGQLSLLLLVLVWLAYRVTWKRTLLPTTRAVSPVLIAVFIFFCAASLSLFNAFSVSAWLNEWLKWAQVLLLIILCLDLVTQREWEWLVFGIVVAASANALIGIYEYFGGSGAEHLVINELFFRAFGTFGQPNPFGGFMGLVAPLAAAASLGYLLQGIAIWRKDHRVSGASLFAAVFYALSFCLLAVALILSWSRGAWLGFLVSLLAILFALPRRWWGNLILLVVALVSLGLAWSTGVLPDSIVERMNSAFSETFASSDVRGAFVTNENYALIERLAHWQAAYNMAEAYPLLGVGFGNYEEAYPNYRLMFWKYPLGHAHNYYLNVFAETGMIGFVAYSFMWLVLLWITWRTRRHPDPLARCVVIGLFGTWVYLAVHSLTDNLYVNNLFLTIGTMFGILAVLHRQTFGSVRLLRHS